VFSFPTNGWYTEQTFETCLRVLQKMETGNLILFFSLDGPREMHDTIRGRGSFDRVKATMARLRPLTRLYPNLYLNVITTVTERNADVAAAFIDELVNDFGPSAISINLFRYHSLQHPPLPAKLIDGYKAAVDAYSKYLREGALKHYGFFGGRILLVKEILQKELIYRVAKFDEFVTPCTAGTLSYVIMEDGRVTACEILPDSIGNITAPAFSFREMVRGEKALTLRRWIADTNCKCTYECAMSTNTLFSWPMSRRMIKSLVGDLAFGKPAI
jgi:sulfatase maturation enzyme AslB (radical SAM superfamily)